MFNFKLIRIVYFSFIFIGLQPTFILGFEMSDQGVDKAVRDYIAFSGAKNIDENIVDALTGIVRDHSNIFNYIANSQTDPAFIPFLRKYSNLKQQFTGLSVNPGVRVLFSNNSLVLRSLNSNSGIIGAGYCDFLTRTVFVDRDFWNHYSERIREAFLFHELAHCDLSRAHEESGYSFMDGLFLLEIFNPDLIHYQEMKGALGISEEEMNNARMNLDGTFQVMIEELFSKTNTCQYIDADSGEVRNKCVQWNLRFARDMRFNYFRCHVAVLLKHLTIGPSQGRDWLELTVMNYNCIHGI